MNDQQPPQGPMPDPANVDERAERMWPITSAVVTYRAKIWTQQQPEQLDHLLGLWDSGTDDVALIVQVGANRVTIDVGRRIAVVDPPPTGTGNYL